MKTVRQTLRTAALGLAYFVFAWGVIFLVANTPLRGGADQIHTDPTKNKITDGADFDLLEEMVKPIAQAAHITSRRAYFMLHSTYVSPAETEQSPPNFIVGVRSDFLALARADQEEAMAILAHEVRHVTQVGTWLNPPVWARLLLPGLACAILLCAVHSIQGAGLAIGTFLASCAVCLVVVELHLTQGMPFVWLIVMPFFVFTVLWTAGSNGHNGHNGQNGIWVIVAASSAIGVVFGAIPYIERLSEFDADRGAYEFMAARKPGDEKTLLGVMCWLETKAKTRGNPFAFMSDHPTNDMRIQALFGPGKNLDDCNSTK